MKILRGKRALITGAGSGIGRAMALELAREGVHLFLIDIDAERLAEVVAEATTLGVSVQCATCDLCQPAQISAVLTEMCESVGPIDILINNAGVAYYGPTEKMTAAQWDWLLGINLLAPIQITRELLPRLLEQPEAHILNVASIAGLVAGGRFCAYHVSKFGMVGFSEALRAEFGRRCVGVTALCPGAVRTNLYRDAQSGKRTGKTPEPPAWLSATPEQVARKAVRAIKKNKRLVLVTPLAHMLYNLKRFAPWFLDLLVHLRRKVNRARAAAAQPTSQRPAA